MVAAGVRQSFYNQVNLCLTLAKKKNRIKAVQGSTYVTIQWLGFLGTSPDLKIGASPTQVHLNW